MLRQLTLHIPKSQYPSFEKFLDTTCDNLNLLVPVLTRAKPSSDVENLAEECSRLSGLPEEAIEAVLAICINLSRLQRTLERPVEVLLNEVAFSLESGGFPRWSEGRSDDWNQRRSILEKLLVADGAIEVMSKVRELLYDVQSILMETSVLTDVRHVYDKGASKVLGGLVLHTLSMEYLEAGETRQIHVVLTAQDMTKLITQIQRAEKKALLAKDMLENQQIPELTPKKAV